MATRQVAHYATVSANFAGKKLVFADGLGKADAVDKDGLERIGLFLCAVEAQVQKFGVRDAQWTVFVERKHRNTDGKSCGAEAIATSLSMAQGSDARLSQNQYEGFKDTISLGLLLSGTIVSQNINWDKNDDLKAFRALAQYPTKRFEAIYGAFLHFLIL